MHFQKSFVILFLVAGSMYSQSIKQIDSINNLYVQGLNIPQDSIISIFKNNVKNAKTIHYKKGVADAYSKLSLAYGYQSKYEESTRFGQESIKLYTELGLDDQVAYRYAELGYSMKYRNMPQALIYMQSGKSLAESLKNDTVLKDIYNNYGVLQEIENELDSALYFYNKSLSIKRRLKDSIGIPYSMSNIAGVYGIQKKYNLSRKYLNDALQLRIGFKDSTGIAENYTQIGEVYMAEKKGSIAVDFIHKSLPISRAKQYRNLTQYNYKLLSDIYKTERKTDSALFYFEQYAAIKDSVHNIKVQESIAALTIEFETGKKENKILQQQVALADQEMAGKRKNYVIFGSLALAFFLGLIGYLFYKQQNLKNKQLIKENELQNALAKIETQNILQEQRLRISRDLHDNIGAQLTFIISSIDNVKYGFQEIGEKLENRLLAISNFTQQTIFELRDTIWAMNKNEITFEDLRARISNFIEQAKLVSTKTSFSFEVEGSNKVRILTSIDGMNIYRIIQEAVNNALKYAVATEISVRVQDKSETTVIAIEDNGVGFNLKEVTDGNGLNNIKKRSRELNGTLVINSVIGKGTTIFLTVLNFEHSEKLNPDS